MTLAEQESRDREIAQDRIVKRYLQLAIKQPGRRKGDLPIPVAVQAPTPRVTRYGMNGRPVEQTPAPLIGTSGTTRGQWLAEGRRKAAAERGHQ